MRASPRLAASEWVVGAAIAALPCGIYLSTMFPGLNGVGDAAKFAFVGKVLGTPHAPGYPLYILISHAFSYVPWGSLAYRMNALSALFGAVTVALTYLLARRLGAGRMASIAAAFALAFGDAFWSRAEYAKYYTLNAALVAWGTFALLGWGQSLRQRDLYLSVAIFALASGNHLIIVALVPALVVYAVAMAPRAVLRPAALGTMAGIVLAGLTQYGLIWWLTVRGAPYLEARATSLADVWRVMTARRFAHEIGAFSLHDLWTTRVPAVGGLLYAEAGLLGLTLIAVGAVVLCRQRPRPAILLVLGAFGVAALTANMSSEEDQGFMLPVFVLLWPLAAVALDWLRSVPRGRYAPLVKVSAIALTAVLPSTLLAANYRANDHHAETAEQDYMEALFQKLPDGAAVVDDDYNINQMLHYMLLGEGQARRGIGRIPRSIEAVQAATADGRAVYAFPTGYAHLHQRGARFEVVDLAVPTAAASLHRQRPLYRFREMPCLEIGNRGWQDVARVLRPRGRLAVRIDNYGPFDTDMTIWMASDEPRQPVVLGATGSGAPVLTSASFRTGDATDDRTATSQLALDGAMLPEAARRAPWLTRATVHVNDRGAQSLFTLDAGGPVLAAVLRARVDQDVPRRATVCTHEFAEADAWPNPSATATHSAETRQIDFADGWYPVERLPDGREFRWTAERATLLIPIGRPATARLSMAAAALGIPRRQNDVVALSVNGVELGARPLHRDIASYAWTVPAARWRAGFNEVRLRIGGAVSPAQAGLSADARVLGLQVYTVQLEPEPPQGR